MPKKTKASAVEKSESRTNTLLSFDSFVRAAMSTGKAPPPATRYRVSEQKDGKWQVIVAAPNAGTKHVSDFADEAEARAWIAKKRKGKK